MPRYNHRLATRSFVKRQVNQSKYSPVRRITVPIEDDAVDSLGWGINLSLKVAQDVDSLGYWSDIDTNETANSTVSAHVKICYIRLRLEFEIGAGIEVFTAYCQRIRAALYISANSINEGLVNYCSDYLGMPYYNRLETDSSILMDKLFFLKTNNTYNVIYDGVKFLKNKFVLKRYETYNKIEGVTALDSDNGSIMLYIIGDDPAGLNAVVSGHVEIGYKHRL